MCHPCGKVGGNNDINDIDSNDDKGDHPRGGSPNCRDWPAGSATLLPFASSTSKCCVCLLECQVQSPGDGVDTLSICQGAMGG